MLRGMPTGWTRREYASARAATSARNVNTLMSRFHECDAATSEI